MYNILTYASYLITGYGISTIVFLIVAAFVKRFKMLKSSYLTAANIFAVILGITVAVITIVNYYSNYANAVDNNFIMPAYRTQFLINIFLTGIVPLLFLIRRLRTNILITFIVIVSLNCFVFYERVYIWLTQIYRDYLPSSWSFEYSQSTVPYIILASIIYFGLAFIFANVRKRETLKERS